MEFVRINETKLKLTLGKDDLEKYALSLEELDYGNTETRRILWQILDEAKHRTGFDAASDRAMIEAYPGRKGGCEIYVTLLKEKKGKEVCKTKTALFRFVYADRLFAAASELFAMGHEGDSALYAGDDSAYYLFLEESTGEHIVKKDELLSSISFLEEYAERQKSLILPSYIREHGTCLLPKGAIQRLAAYGGDFFKKTV